MSEDINVTDGTVLESLNNKVDLDGGNYLGSGLEEIINTELDKKADKTEVNNAISEINTELNNKQASGSYVTTDKLQVFDETPSSFTSGVFHFIKV